MNRKPKQIVANLLDAGAMPNAGKGVIATSATIPSIGSIRAA